MGLLQAEHWEHWSAGDGCSRCGVGGRKGVQGRVPPFQLCARSYPGVLKAGSWQWDSEGSMARGDERIGDGLWGGALREGGNTP